MNNKGTSKLRKCLNVNIQHSTFNAQPRNLNTTGVGRRRARGLRKFNGGSGPSIIGSGSVYFRLDPAGSGWIRLNPAESGPSGGNSEGEGLSFRFWICDPVERGRF
jgi:hypothetical protein